MPLSTIGDFDVAAARVVVQVSHVPVTGGGLDAVQRVAGQVGSGVDGVGGADRACRRASAGRLRHAFETRHWLRPFHLRVTRQLGDQGIGALTLSG